MRYEQVTPEQSAEAAALFDFKADTKVLVYSEVTWSQHWMPFSDALFVAAVHASRRIAFAVLVGYDREDAKVWPLFAFNGSGSFTGDERALRLVEHQVLMLEETLRDFFMLKGPRA